MIHEIENNDLTEFMDHKNVVMDFYADWCGPCKSLAPVIKEISEANPDVVFLKINVDANPDLADKYDISSIPTLIFASDGEIVDTSIGLITAGVFQNKVNQLKQSRS